MLKIVLISLQLYTMGALPITNTCVVKLINDCPLEPWQKGRLISVLIKRDFSVQGVSKVFGRPSYVFGDDISGMVYAYAQFDLCVTFANVPAKSVNLKPLRSQAIEIQFSSLSGKW